MVFAKQKEDSRLLHKFRATPLPSTRFGYSAQGWLKTHVVAYVAVVADSAGRVSTVIKAVESRIVLIHAGQWTSAAFLTLRAYMQANAFDEYVSVE